MDATLGGDLPLPDKAADCLSKAAEAASNINALLIAKGKLTPSQVGRSAVKKTQVVKKFDAEVEINDAPLICRDILGKNAKQEEISKKSGAFISTKGRYLKPEQRALAINSRERPLYLYIQAETEENVQRAVSEINQVILKHGGIVNQTRGSTISVAAPSFGYQNQIPINVASDPQLDRVSNGLSMLPPPQQPDLSQPPPNAFISAQQNAAASMLTSTQMQFIEAKMFIGLEHAPPEFDVRNKILGSEGSFLQHIHSTSGAVVTLRGRNSGYLNPETAQESVEPMHIHLKHMTNEGLEQAKSLANHLIKTVQEDYSHFQRHLALQPPVALSHQAGHSAVPLLARQQNGTTSVIGFQTPEQQVMISSSSAPLSIVMSQGPANHLPSYSLARPPTYVQAVPPMHPVTSGLTARKPVGYNSFASQGVEIVHETLPVSRPLTSIQPFNGEMMPQNRSLIAAPSHELSLKGRSASNVLLTEASPTAPIHAHMVSQPLELVKAPTAVPVSLHLVQSEVAYQSVPQSVLAAPAAVSTPLVPHALSNQPPPSLIANHLPVMTSQPLPPTVTSLPPPAIVKSLPPPVMSNLPPPAILTSHPPPVLPSHPPPGAPGHPPPMLANHPPPPVNTSQPPPSLVIANHPPHPVITSHPPPVMASQAMPESRLVFVSQSQPLTEVSQIPVFSVPASQPTISIPPSETVAYIVQSQPVETQLVCIDQPDMSIPPPSAVLTEQPPPHQPLQPVAVNEFGHPVEVVELASHHQPVVHLQPTSSNGPGAMMSSLMDPELGDSASHVIGRRPLSALAPLEPPPHLADGYRSSKRSYSEYDQYYSMAGEHRLPYKGSGRPYSAITPSPPTSPNSILGPPRHKRWHNDGPRHARPPPPPPV